MARPNQDKINIVTHRKQKALTIVGAFCFYSISHSIWMLYTERKHMPAMKTQLETVAWFKSKNEIGNLHRNNEKLPLQKSLANQ